MFDEVIFEEKVGLAEKADAYGMPGYRVDGNDPLAVREALRAQGLTAEVTDSAAPAAVDYIVGTADGPVQDFAPYTRARAVISLWAGVERFLANPTLTQPLVRMVDPEGLTAGMVEYVTGHALRHHLGLDRQLARQDGTWAPDVPPLAVDRPVAVLGLGALGGACARALAGLGFPVRGWSCRPKDIDGVHCLAGEAALDTVLDGAEIVVALLPNTPATENILDARTLALPAEGAVVINPGRGALIDDAALLAALDRGRIGHATLDVFRQEPLPADHPFWAHPRVTVTPHVASATRPATAAKRVAEAIEALEVGRTPHGLVDRAAGY